MITTVLDFEKAEIFFIHHEITDDVESLLLEEYNFSESNIQRMTTEKLVFQTLQ